MNKKLVTLIIIQKIEIYQLVQRKILISAAMRDYDIGDSALCYKRSIIFIPKI
jgi:hypothetical protein